MGYGVGKLSWLTVDERVDSSVPVVYYIGSDAFVGFRSFVWGVDLLGVSTDWLRMLIRDLFLIWCR